MSEPTADELRLAANIARKYGARWSSVEVEDVQSVLYLWLCEHMPKVERWRAEPNGKGKLLVTLKREALKFCTRETAARQGQPLNRENFYNEAMLERALPFVFEAWPETTVRQNPTTGQALDRPFEFSNALTIMADISGAFHGLPADMKELLELRFRDGLTFDEIGELRGSSKQGAQQLIQRCIKRLCDSLAGERL